MRPLLACGGCGVLAEGHPVVCVMRPEDVPEGVTQSPAGPNGFVGVPVCNKCHQEPASAPRKLKGHYFYAQDAPTGVYHAGSNDKVGGH
jgi:hypothetical protein